MTKTFSGDQNNDLFLDTDGNIAISSGAQAVAELCKSAIEAQLHEMPLAYNSGTPNMQLIWNGAPNLKQYEAILRTTISNVSGVLSIKSLDVQIAGDAVVYAAQISTVYGAAALNA